MVSALTPARLDDIEEALKNVMDIEIGINVFDLGLIYGLAWDDDTDTLVIQMTLTSAGCPEQEVLTEQTEQALIGVVERHRINWVWMPPWTPDKITDDGRSMISALGLRM
ncbi:MULTISPECIES: metal-sulfur cluster assembly factor [unclassified Cryobacterium]|uniref:metal-sulfur cluster assembly factor n=1 Tax=unclassified Cryobacterium TaxID=2649013 RepID=UPI000CE3A209|nr:MULTISPECIES: metal-sulfur cluster assembly factor [unclassified Cryobacterium]